MQGAVAAAASWEELVAALGSRRSDIGRIRGAARRYGIDTRQLDDTRRANPPESLTPQRNRLPAAAEALATAWLLMAGLQVSIPATPSPFDLLASDRSGNRRIQVKTTTHRDRDGRWVVVVAHRPYRLEQRGGREPYDHDDVDEFLIINGAGELYLIPIAAIAGRISIVLDHYRACRVGMIGDLFESPGSGYREPRLELDHQDPLRSDDRPTAEAG